jgi:hypothetical protein
MHKASEKSHQPSPAATCHYQQPFFLGMGIPFGGAPFFTGFFGFGAIDRITS